MTRDLPMIAKGGEPHDDNLREFFRPLNGDSRESPCPPPELLRALHANALSPALRERVVSHLARCTMCQVLADSIEEVKGDNPTAAEQQRILRRIRTELGDPKRPTAARWSWLTLATAAAVVFLVATGVVIWQSMFGPPATNDASMLRVEKPPVRVVEPAPGVVTDVAAEPAPPQELQASLELYRADRFDEAARSLALLASRFPGDASAQFYLGVTELLIASRTHGADARDQYARAAFTLHTARALATHDRERTHETDWYLALAFQGAGEHQRAAEKLAALCRDGGAYAKQACAGFGEHVQGSPLDPPPRLPPAQ